VARTTSSPAGQDLNVSLQTSTGRGRRPWLSPPLRTVWVYKGRPNPPVKPSGVPNRRFLFNGCRTRAELRNLEAEEA